MHSAHPPPCASALPAGEPPAGHTELCSIETTGLLSDVKRIQRVNLSLALGNGVVFKLASLLQDTHNEAGRQLSDKCALQAASALQAAKLPAGHTQ
jgi:hypothetical protein